MPGATSTFAVWAPNRFLAYDEYYCNIIVTGKITVRMGLHQGSSLILDVMGQCIKEQPLGVCCLQSI